MTGVAIVRQGRLPRVTGPERTGVDPAVAGSGGSAATAPASAATAPDLAALMAAVGRGDREAFGALYDALAPTVHGTARRVLRDPDLAADVTQEVMVEIWRTAPRYDPALGSVRAWVATTAHRRAVDRVRSVQAQRTREDRDAAESYHPPYDDVVEQVEARADRTRVRDCLDTLTQVQRETLTLAYYGGRTYREVADHLGAALPTVKSRIRDGLARLRDCLGVS